MNSPVFLPTLVVVIEAVQDPPRPPPPGWRGEEDRVLALNRGAAACAASAGPSALTGVDQYPFCARRVRVCV